MNFEKQRGAQNTIKKLIVDDKEIIVQTHILGYVREFYETLYKKHKQKTEAEIKKFLRHLNILKLHEDKSKLCDEDLTQKDLYDSLKSMPNDKSPGNDGLTTEFYETFWSKLKEIFVESVLEAKEKGHVSISQRQAIIKLINKKDRDKGFIKICRPISLLNVNLKIISKALSEKLKKVLPDLISSQQTAYVKNRHIGESGRLIPDVIEIAKVKKLDGFLVPMDIEKAFDSLDYDFLILSPEKCGFGKKFILLVKILIRDQGSCY